MYPRMCMCSFSYRYGKIACTFQLDLDIFKQKLCILYKNETQFLFQCLSMCYINAFTQNHCNNCHSHLNFPKKNENKMAQFM